MSHRSARHGQQLLRLCAILTVTTVAVVVDGRKHNSSGRHQLPSFKLKGRLAVAEKWQFVQMPSQHRLLPAQNSFLAVCTIIKVRLLKLEK